MEKQRSTILYPLGFEAGKPVPVPKMFENGGKDYYTKVGENRDIKPLKPIGSEFKKDGL